MAIERIRPIVDAHGDPFYVIERDYIGAEHANAQARWTRDVHPVLTRQHTAEGRHDYLPIPRVAIIAEITRVSGAGQVIVDPRSRAMDYKQASGPDDTDPWAYQGLISATYTAPGTARFSLAKQLPSSTYGLINWTLGVASGGTLSGTPVGPQRVGLSLFRISDTEFEILRLQGTAPSHGFVAFGLVC